MNLDTRAARDALEVTGRIGYAVKGFVYGLVGFITLRGVLGVGGGGEDTPGTKEAVKALVGEPFGRILIGLTAAGLVAYTIWRFAEAILDPSGRAKDQDAKRTLKRVGFAISGLAYGALALYAASLAIGGGGSSGGDTRREITSQIMSAPAGRWLIGLVGAVVVGVGLHHFRRAYNASFMDDYDGEMSSTQRTWARRIGRLGLSARGVTFLIIGALTLTAAWSYDPDQAKGLGGALAALAGQPYGPYLLGAVAAGLIAYAAYCLSRARWKRLRT